MTSEHNPPLTAAVLLIGDEILSGRTQDANLAYIAKFLGVYGIDLCEARVVRDVAEEIAAALNALRTRFTYVFTTGGIGPTHDDITVDAVGLAFEAEVDFDAGALEMLAARYKPGEFNEMRRRMARIPKGASLIHNSVSVAPGFQIENVFVMAGVPMIMRAMLEDVGPRLARGRVVVSCTITARVSEGRVAAKLAQIQHDHAAVTIGSYPFFAESGSGVQLVVRGRDPDAVENAARAIEAGLEAESVESARIDS